MDELKPDCPPVAIVAAKGVPVYAKVTLNDAPPPPTAFVQCVDEVPPPPPPVRVMVTTAPAGAL